MGLSEFSKFDSLRFGSDPVLDASPAAHAARRWAHVVIAVKPLKEDPKTLDAWGRAVGVSRGTLAAH